MSNSALVSNAEVVRALADAFRATDRQAAEQLVAPTFHFTSPQDDHLDRATWFEVCFPTSGHFVSHETLQVIEEGDLVFTRYEYELADGTRYRNMEASRVVDGQVVEVEVYFGGAV